MTSNRSRKGLVIASMLALAFAGGAAAGVAGDRLVNARPGIRVKLDDGSALLDRLSLSPEQRARAESILARRSPLARVVMAEAAAKLRLVADSADAELREILTPSQRATLDSLRRSSRRLLIRRERTPEGGRVDTVLDTVSGAPAPADVSQLQPITRTGRGDASRDRRAPASPDTEFIGLLGRERDGLKFRRRQVRVRGNRARGPTRAARGPRQRKTDPTLSSSDPFKCIDCNWLQERATGLEPATSSLGSWHSTN